MTIDERIEEARQEHHALMRVSNRRGSPDNAAVGRLVRRAYKRLDALEKVRDGKMVEVYATVCTSPDGAWVAHGTHQNKPTDTYVLMDAHHAAGDSIDILHGFSRVPQENIRESEADSEEVPSV